MSAFTGIPVLVHLDDDTVEALMQHSSDKEVCIEGLIRRILYQWTVRQGYVDPPVETPKVP